MKQRIPRKLKKRWKKLGFRFTFDPFKFLDELQGMKRLGRYANNPDHSNKPPTEEDFDNMIKKLNEEQNTMQA